MKHELQFATALPKDGARLSLRPILRELEIPASFDWADPEGCARAIVEAFGARTGWSIEDVRVYVNKTFGYAEINCEGLQVRWHNAERPLVSLTDDEKVALFCDAERYFLGTYFKHSESEKRVTLAKIQV